MNKKEFVDAVAGAADVSKADAEKVIDSLSGVVTARLAQGDDLTLPGLGKFTAVHQAAKSIVTFGVPKDIPAKNVPKFKIAKPLKDAIA